LSLTHTLRKNDENSIFYDERNRILRVYSFASFLLPTLALVSSKSECQYRAATVLSW
jgi:hypothetical protein